MAFDSTSLLGVASLCAYHRNHYRSHRGAAAKTYGFLLKRHPVRHHRRSARGGGVCALDQSLGSIGAPGGFAGEEAGQSKKDNANGARTRKPSAG